MVGSFEEKDWLRFCKALKMFPKSGLAACIVRGIRHEGDNRTQRFIFLEKAIWGKSQWLEKVLSEISQGTKYLYLPCKFFRCDFVKSVLKICLIKKRVSTLWTVERLFLISGFTFISVHENGLVGFSKAFLFHQIQISDSCVKI